jgi:hypothetical protein
MMVAILAGVTGALAIALGLARRLGQKAYSAEVDRLLSSRPIGFARWNPRSIDEAPAPVARYLRWALPPGYAIHAVRMSQTGTLRTGVYGRRWLKFEAEHIAAPEQAGFLWDARVEIAPFLHLRVRDALLEGKGSGQSILLSVLPLATDEDTPEMNAGSLHRFLAEAPWYPTALLPGARLHWSPIGERRALATITAHGVSVSLEFRFAETGEITGIYTPARWAHFGKSYRQLPWEGRFRDYRKRDGIFVPGEAEVGWYVEGEWRAVWRGRTTAFAAEGGGV